MDKSLVLVDGPRLCARKCSHYDAPAGVPVRVSRSRGRETAGQWPARACARATDDSAPAATAPDHPSAGYPRRTRLPAGLFVVSAAIWRLRICCPRVYPPGNPARPPPFAYSFAPPGAFAYSRSACPPTSRLLPVRISPHQRRAELAPAADTHASLASPPPAPYTASTRAQGAPIRRRAAARRRGAGPGGPACNTNPPAALSPIRPVCFTSSAPS